MENANTEIRVEDVPASTTPEQNTDQATEESTPKTSLISKLAGVALAGPAGHWNGVVAAVSSAHDKPCVNSENKKHAILNTPFEALMAFPQGARQSLSGARNAMVAALDDENGGVSAVKNSFSLSKLRVKTLFCPCADHAKERYAAAKEDVARHSVACDLT